VSIDGSDFVGVFGLFNGSRDAAESVGDEVEGEDSHDHEDDGLESVGPSGGAGSPGKDVGEDDDANDESGEPGWNGSVGGPFGKDAGDGPFCFGDTFDGFGCADDPDEEVGDDEEDKDGEEEVAECFGIKAGAEVLDLGNVAVALSDGPELDSDEKETSGVNETRRGGHEAVSSDPGTEGLAGGTDESESGHGGSKDRHEKHEGAD